MTSLLLVDFVKWEKKIQLKIDSVGMIFWYGEMRFSVITHG